MFFLIWIFNLSLNKLRHEQNVAIWQPYVQMPFLKDWFCIFIETSPIVFWEQLSISESGKLLSRRQAIFDKRQPAQRLVDLNVSECASYSYISNTSAGNFECCKGHRSKTRYTTRRKQETRNGQMHFTVPCCPHAHRQPWAYIQDMKLTSQ